MAEITNKLLLFFVIVSIGLSIVSTFTLLNKIGTLVQEKVVTGRATTDTGNITVTILSSVSITLNNNDTINFGSGFVNTSLCVNNATLYAGQTYNDTNGVDCWTNNTAMPTSLILENDGNVNVSVTVQGENESSFFNGYAGSDPYNLTWRARQNETTSCDTGLATTYDNFDGTAQTVCGDLLYQPTTDTIAVDVAIIIPATNLPTGTYENASILFTAAPT